MIPSLLGPNEGPYSVILIHMIPSSLGPNKSIAGCCASTLSTMQNYELGLADADWVRPIMCIAPTEDPQPELPSAVQMSGFARGSQRAAEV